MTLDFDPILAARRNWEAIWPAGPAMMAATSVIRAQRIILGRVDTCLEPFELTFAGYEALVLLSFTRTGAMRLGRMGDRLMVNPPSVTSMVDRLCAQGRVERVRHPSDRRAVLARITSLGRRDVERATAAVVDVSLGMAGLAPEELETISDLLVGFRRAAGDFVTIGPGR